jgi:hypothetical protein
MSPFKQALGLHLWLSILQAVALLLFTRGFLLTRVELPFTSHCDDLPIRCACSLFWRLAYGDKVRRWLKGFESRLRPLTPQTTSRTHLASARADGGALDCPRATSDAHSNSVECWTKPAFSKLVILVVDALRWDFVAPNGEPTSSRMSWKRRLAHPSPLPPSTPSTVLALTVRRVVHVQGPPQAPAAQWAS